VFAAGAAAVTLAGWWLLPVFAAAWVRVLPRTKAEPATCALGAAVGWALLVAWDGVRGPVSTLARRAGGVFHLPGWAFVLITLLFAALLGATAAMAAEKSRIR
jgi:hypothetical protein